MRINRLARTASHSGIVNLDLVWPEHPNRPGFSGPIHNQRYFYDISTLPHKNRLFLTGLGAGKTLTAAELLVRVAIENPGMISLMLAKSMPMIKRVQLPALMLAQSTIAMESGQPLIANHNRSDHAITWLNGHMTYYLGTQDTESIRGIESMFTWGDELRTWENANEAYKVIRGRRRGARSKYLMTAFTTTPMGRRGPVMHWVSRCTCEIAPGVRESPDGHWLMVQMKTSDNDALDDNYEEGLREEYDPRFARQELDGELLDLSGRVFSDVFSTDEWPKGNVISNFRFDSRFHELRVAIDWGAVYPHVLWIAHDKRAYDDPSRCIDVIIDEFCLDGASDEVVIQNILPDREQIWNRRYDSFHPDIRGREENALLRTRYPGIPMRFAAKSWLDRIRTGIYIMRSRLLTAKGHRRLAIYRPLLRQPQNSTPEGRGIFNALQNYDFARTREGLAKELYKDDSWYVHGVDALRYYCVTEYPFKRQGITLV